MPQNKFAFVRYRIIDNLLRRNDFVKTSKIVEVCLGMTGFRVSRRTIQLDIEAMKNDDFLGFYAPIEYHNRMKAYYYAVRDYRASDMTLRFSPEEIQVIKSISDTCKDQIPFNYRLLLQDMIIKMELLIE